MAGAVNIRAYAELNDFLGSESRGLTVRRPCRSHQTVKDILEAMGIPHTEVDLILVNGNPVGFEHRPAAEDRIAVYPMFEALDIESTARLRPVPLRDPRFVIDVNLGRLAQLLRVLGFDVWWSNDAEDQTLADTSRDQQRILLTRDRCLLKRRAITHGLFVHSEQPEEQTLEVIRRLDLRRRVAPFTRCVRCNGRLSAVTKEEVMDQLEPLTRRYYDKFSRCADCRRIYWPGSHHARLTSLVDGLLEQAERPESM
ncbi:MULTISPECIES: Mut7-C RNAse domain-containing protein [unclassified Mycolicibacterium]|uniref:Mut7-C RNAse domain-containing protein n=1 Tax=unclassified Mycolicibacterium TaxID=2636767 RepID=UPI0012DC5949|nr:MULTISPECIES: Mut7-C RNAse domain-containing protein [unclassified Mycolicibacterium]MUL81549.1 hypothetical protein [Mycolicibacterium sp. CBMA 329]MUL87315.1 hypothetical protein [Mycolicibacterium sp. CBMA 331]MUM02602.1 hypothetical protein [Mycolicibacterium sp. CBMA 334]MUM25163.1 hypothetical protein [Mycolicibacterium sp. CBMA 295]MUM37612.1 hypothetical protein [Mycolicibacterium sp. CBMA 247]